MSGAGWPEVWHRRTVEACDRPHLAQLLAADGYESGFAGLTEQAWTDAAARRMRELELVAGHSVFDVGCGAGAFLYPLAALGYMTGGLDLSPALIDAARRALPDGRFHVGEAIDLELTPRHDAVVAVGVFLYFPDLGYAERVLDRMVAGARRAVALYDMPDEATREQDLERRQKLAGGAAAYARRYAGLDHRFYRRDWVVEALRDRGLVDVQVADQDITGYGNAPYRFNAWGFVGRQHA